MLEFIVVLRSHSFWTRTNVLLSYGYYKKRNGLLFFFISTFL